MEHVYCCPRCNFSTDKHKCEICSAVLNNAGVCNTNSVTTLVNNPMVSVISIGYRCSTSAILNELKFKTCSYPFDWIVSNLDVVKDCILTDFVHFLNKDNYALSFNNNVLPTQSPHSSLNLSVPECYVNTYYEKDLTKPIFESNMALPHKNLTDDYDYYLRCIKRFKQTLTTSDGVKVIVYIHPVLSLSVWTSTCDHVLNEFS